MYVELFAVTGSKNGMISFVIFFLLLPHRKDPLSLFSVLLWLESLFFSYFYSYGDKVITRQEIFRFLLMNFSNKRQTFLFCSYFNFLNIQHLLSLLLLLAALHTLSNINGVSLKQSYEKSIKLLLSTHNFYPFFCLQPSTSN